MAALTHEQRLLVSQYIDAYQGVESHKNAMRKNQDDVDVIAAELVNSFRWQELPDVIVTCGMVIHINYEVHCDSNPSLAVRIFRNAIFYG